MRHTQMPDRQLSIRTVLVIARAVRDSRTFSADAAFLLLREVRSLCPIPSPSLLSERRLAVLDATTDDRAYLDEWARFALEDLIARLSPVEGPPVRREPEGSPTIPLLTGP